MRYKLIDLREEKNLKVKDVAGVLGVVSSVYSEWENNKLSLPTRRIYQLANYYEVNIDYMLGLTDKRIHIKTKNDIDIKSVSLKLKEVRRSLNMSMRDLASEFNTTSSAISNYENCKYLILGSLLIELSKMSGYSIDWILGRSKDKYIMVKEKV